MALLDILPFTHELLRQHIRVGDTVMDGTAGNGYDTAFLAQCVGESGRVVAFDIQSAAIEATQNRLLQLGLTDRVQLIQDGHQHAAQYISQSLS
ncbi:class I SAM-dependent methyltransferase, partial [Kingella kingae]|uniref:class I SAM-dependent methyltransferase n=1 Tax=Kingella kingae TaxID=504 RepID=UPI001EE20A48